MKAGAKFSFGFIAGLERFMFLSMRNGGFDRMGLVFPGRLAAAASMG